MINYNNFKSADFIGDPDFRAWVFGRKQEGDVDWKNIAAQNPSVSKEMEIARMFLTNIEGKSVSVPDLYIQHFSERILENHRKSVSAVRLPSRRWYGLSTRLFYMAAAILVTFGVGWYYFTYDQKQSSNALSVSWAAPELKLTTRVNRSESPELIVLKDGSKITLQPKSSVTYHEPFDGKERNVQLEGEAFFEVVKNSDRPFLVHFNDLTVRVVGTSFNIRSYGKEEGSRVTVKTGKVSVSASRAALAQKNGTDKLSSAIMLTANQEVFYKKAQGYFERSIAARTQIVDKAISEQDFVFNETPLSTIFSKLDKAYGIPIIFDEQQIYGCSLTASLADEPLLEKLNLICKTMKGSYEVIDGQIVIDIKSCRNSIQ